MSKFRPNCSRSRLFALPVSGVELARAAPCLCHVLALGRRRVPWSARGFGRVVVDIRCPVLRLRQLGVVDVLYLWNTRRALSNVMLPWWSESYWFGSQRFCPLRPYVFLIGHCLLASAFPIGSPLMWVGLKLLESLSGRSLFWYGKFPNEADGWNSFPE